MKPSKIFYLACDSPGPSGGEKHNYQHVDILNAEGFEAYALHERLGYRHSWFENDTRVMYFQSFWDVYDIRRDYIVVSEPAGMQTTSLPGRKVIFNKNLYTGFKAFGSVAPTAYPYTDPSVVATFAVSQHNYDHLRFAFPSANIYRMHAHIDCERFSYRPLTQKRKRIAFVSKATEPFSALFHTLMARARAGLNNLNEYEWVLLKSHTEVETAAILEDSLILISFSTHEGLQRALLEGMACGCLVIAYGSGPALEYLPAEYRFAADDFMAISRQIELITAASVGELDRWRDLTLTARRIAETFTRGRQKEHLVRAWNEILSKHPTEAVTRSGRRPHSHSFAGLE